jgi:hypothetical protein
MKLLRLFCAIAVVTMAVSAGAQEAEPGSGSETAAQAPTLTPDDSPLSGARERGLGLPLNLHSYIVPRLTFSQSLSSNPPLAATTRESYRGFTSVAGDVQVQHYFSRSGELSYVGAARYNSYREDVLTTHGLRVSQRVAGRQWSLMLSDQLSYTPASDFGYAGMEGLMGSVPGGGLAALGKFGLGNVAGVNPALLANQSILTQPSGRISNTSVGEVGYRIDARNSLTVTGSHTLLHSLDAALLEIRQYNATAGYNYTLNPHTGWALTYGYGLFQYPDSGRDISTHTVGMTLGHQLLGKLNLTASAASQVYEISEPTLLMRDLTWNSRVGLRYGLKKTQLALNYLRTITGGSGVLAGAKTSDVRFSASRTFARQWHTSADFGYAHNTALTTSRSFESKYVGAGLSRQIVSNLALYLHYSLQHQKTNTACVGLACGIPTLQHTLSLGINWTPRPIGIF